MILHASAQLRVESSEFRVEKKFRVQGSEKKFRVQSSELRDGGSGFFLVSFSSFSELSTLNSELEGWEAEA
jgi:hypothetical protein